MDEDILREFLIETYENLNKLDDDLLALEKDPGSKSVLDNIFRTFHSCKGACGFLGLKKLESITHSGENLLGALRDNKIKMDSRITDALLLAVDSIKKILAAIESERTEGSSDYSGIIDSLNALNSPVMNNVQKEISVKPSAANFSNINTEKVKSEHKQEPKDLSDEVNNLNIKEQEIFANIIDEIMSNKNTLMPEDIEAALIESKTRAAGSNKKIETGPVSTDNTLSDIVNSDIKANSSQQEAVCDAQKNQSVLDSSIRVNIDLLDKLMNLVGELVLARNQFLQIVSSSEDANFIGISQRLNLITSELQEGIMKTRMQPINNIWRTFPRVVREISASLNKKVRMEMNGKETELDKTVIEAIKDPLTHIIRNSIDHGIEEPEIRKKKNKDVEGVLALRAFHEDGQVNIEISDDGAGIDINAVKQKALQRELISASQAAVMSDKDLLNLIFLPGFSTAKKVTNISGRGVGMDVVRKNIEKIGGTVDLENKPDGGTIVKIKIPLTLAIIPALIVTCGKDSYAIAQVNLLEIVRLKSFEARKKIEEIYGSPVYRLRGKLLPLVYLNKELKTESGCCHCDINSAEDYNVNIIVLQAANRQFGLIVDAINDTEEIVVKPLDKLLKNIPVFAGATIRGDGKVALIIDVLGLAKSSGVISTINDKLIYEKNFSIAKHNSETKRLLLFKNYDGGRMGILLSKVSRLEDLPASNIEKSGGLDVVQYRNQIMPLINLSNILPERRSDERKHEGSSYKDNIQLVVYSDEEKSYGIVVESIIDIIEAQLELQNATAREGTFGSCVILNKVTEILDMDSIIKKFETMIMNSSK